MTTDGVGDTTFEREPIRTCIGCRTARAQVDLVRCTLRDGSFTVDGASAGRGAWLCRATLGACGAAALERGAFQRAWRTELDDVVRDRIGRWLVDAARSAGGDRGRAGSN